ncbi:MAG: glycosyltransferase family 1 protein [Acidobacteriaceae bacterium]|nr:glycosyltransferase family 1 protein [Acidobacteriaceae bacterium]
MQRQGDEVMVFAPGEGILEYHGARIERVPGLRFPLYPELTLALPSPAFRAKLQAFRPDVIHVADPALLGLAGIYYGDVLPLPLVISYHTRLPKYLHYYRLGALEPTVWKLMRLRHSRADVNLCTSTAMAEELKAHGIERVQLWPRAVDTNEFHPRFADPEMRTFLSEGHPECPLFVYVGRLSREKNIEALRSVLDAIPAARLAIIGGGPYKPALQSLFSNRPAFFAGYLTGERLAAAMASADALVLPSETETLGLVLMEAMAAGSLVIGANRGGIPDIIQNEVNGLLFDTQHANGLPEAARRVVVDPDLCQRLRAEARRQAEGWSWAEATRALRSYYRTALTMPRGAKPARANSFYVQAMKKAAIGGIKVFLR